MAVHFSGRMSAEPNLEATIDNTIMDAYLDEGESYEDAEIYARRAMNKLKHSAENELLDKLQEPLDDEDYWEPYTEAIEDYWYSIKKYVNDAESTYRGIVNNISLWEDVAEQSAHNLSYVVEKTWKFKYDAIRMIYNGEVDAFQYIVDEMDSATFNLLVNWNPEDRDYEANGITLSIQLADNDTFTHIPTLKDLRFMMGRGWTEESEPYAFDLFRSEENKYTPLSGKRRTKGRKQKWIPVAIDFLRHNGKSTASEIYPSLPDYRGAGTPVNAMALSNRLIRMPDIFIVDKSRKPYTYTVANMEMNAEFEQLSDAVVAVTDRYDENVGYVVATDGDDEDIDFDNVGVAVLDDDMEPIAEIEIGQTYFGYDKEDDDYYHSEQYYAAESGVSTIKIYVENEDKRIGGKEVSFEMSNHTLANEDILHEAIENRLMDILQEPFGSWMLISIKELDAEEDVHCNECGGINNPHASRGPYKRRQLCECTDSFEANFNPNQPRDSEGRWVEQVEVSEMIASEPLMDLDIDELEALATAIRLQDETFPEVGMLLEQIGDTAENRQGQ